MKGITLWYHSQVDLCIQTQNGIHLMNQQLGMPIRHITRVKILPHNLDPET